MQCVCYSRGRFVSSSRSFLHLRREVLYTVGKLTLTRRRSSIVLKWTELFLLSADEGSPNITYCVKSFVEGLGPPETTCSVQGTEFVFNFPSRNWCLASTVLFTVTPTTKVSSGIPSSVEYAAPIVEQRHPPKVVARSLLPRSGAEPSVVVVTMSALVCSCNATFLNARTGESLEVPEESLTINRKRVTIIANLDKNTALGFQPCRNGLFTL